MARQLTSLYGLAVTAALSLTLNAHADTFEWTNGLNGNFTDPAMWTNTSGVDLAPPNTGDIAVFDVAGPYIVTLGGTPLTSPAISRSTRETSCP